MTETALVKFKIAAMEEFAFFFIPLQLNDWHFLP
jgi:hypothetical protein